jgi:hypothetical protein
MIEMPVEEVKGTGKNGVPSCPGIKLRIKYSAENIITEPGGQNKKGKKKRKRILCAGCQATGALSFDTEPEFLAGMRLVN